MLQFRDTAHVDTGASFNHHSADMQRNVPVDGKFTPEQRKLYEVALNVQVTAIPRIKPGVTWWELHNLAVQMLPRRRRLRQGPHLRHRPLHRHGGTRRGRLRAAAAAGMALSIEQGVAPPDGPRVAFEDECVIVTDTGHDWISPFLSIPDLMTDVEAMAARPSSFESFTGKTPLSMTSSDDKAGQTAKPAAKPEGRPR